MVNTRKKKQQTLEATLGRPRVRPAIKTPKKRTPGAPSSSSPAPMKSSPLPPPSSFMHSSQLGGSARKRRLVFDDSSSESRESAGEENEKEERLAKGKVRRGKQRRVSSGSSESSEELPVERKREPASLDDSGGGDDSDDLPLVTPSSRRRRRMISHGSDDDDDDEPLGSSPVKRRKLVRRNVVSSPIKIGDDEEDVEEDQPAPASARSRRTGQRPMTQKEKARELLRRKRAGEAISEESSGEEEEEPVKAMYDTDSDHVALNEFEDDEEGVIEPTGTEKKGQDKKKAKREKKQAADDENGESGDTDDFIVDDSDGALGVPEEVYLNMPLEFTAHSHKPLKEHFRDAVEWLVQFKVNPGFSEKGHPLYRMAWKKLDDEVRGLATSKFASAAWKMDFYMALRARPYFVNSELPRGDLLEARNCGACGRSGHPARHMITFSGSPYYKDATNLERFLQPVESMSSSDSDEDASGSHDENDEDEDEDGNRIPKETKQWFIGAVCNSNAETAHNLMHWKQALLDWVDARLHEEGHMAPSRLAERVRMRPKQRYKLVDAILEHWVSGGVVRALYQDFKATIEAARNKSTRGRYR